jgi:hypothetical protein
MNADTDYGHPIGAFIKYPNYASVVCECRNTGRVSVQGGKSLGGHFACLCQGFEIYEVKKNIIIFQKEKENGNTFTLLIIFIVKSLQKEQNSTNLLL